MCRRPQWQAYSAGATPGCDLHAFCKDCGETCCEMGCASVDPTSGRSDSITIPGDTCAGHGTASETQSRAAPVLPRHASNENFNRNDEARQSHNALSGFVLLSIGTAGFEPATP